MQQEGILFKYDECSHITTWKYILEDIEKLIIIVLFITVTNIKQHYINLFFLSVTNVVINPNGNLPLKAM